MLSRGIGFEERVVVSGAGEVLMAGWEKSVRLTWYNLRCALPAPPGGLALGGVVKLREAQPAGRELVQIRRRDLTAITAQVGKAQVIRKNEDDVWFSGIGGRKSWPSQTAEAGECDYSD